ncbi:xylose import ATP-binding protein XylG [Collibacillus ludicampi]|uniref:Xylose import ATP-binding protein XylG n=1 Tax=Collibacillus ludicampi TaxID=2771369 RepID=A0AAV4LFR5_9BACL|nr:xylose ABC transporter ATP-binding protein [Collibacillus ludicampi]GIM46700.1 xylose import ATP-binding protein XylG [Collibacillus ludicampi]
MYALEMNGITKEFPGVKALNQVSFKVRPGEIHALCGENGAGKSTLMKVLSGLYPAGTYEGDIYVFGERKEFQSIKDAEDAGIVIIHQELALVKELTVGENLFLGAEPGKYGLVDWNEMYVQTKKWLERVGLQVSPDTKAGRLGIGQQQLVEIAKALAKNARILILDEPTAALTESEVETLVHILDQLRQSGVACIYISHKLNEVFRLADTITVLRDGQSVATHPASELNEDRVIALMVGRELTERYPYVQRKAGDVVLEVSDYVVYDEHDPTKKRIDGVSFRLHKGEILGIAGLMGAGRTELAMSLFGAYGGQKEGSVKVENQSVRIHTVSDAIRAGIAYVSEDRKRFGLVLGMDVKTNITLPNMDEISYAGVVNHNEEIKHAQQYREDLRIKTASLETAVGTLSGGNQQKVVLSKWLMANPKILILDEPTRGIDVGAKYEIYNLMNQLVEQGVAVIMISSELPEILGMSDRILVMHEGKITAEFSREEASQEAIMVAATGGR